jgi:integrase
MQKNDTDQSIPLLPWFEELLIKTPAASRSGWVFQPLPLRTYEDDRLQKRPETDWVGKIIERIGRKANVIVEPENEKTGRPMKFATAHDLRRSCGQRLRDSGVPPLLICRVMRHESWETTRRHYAPGDIQNEAKALRDVLNANKSGQESKSAG